MKNRLKILFSVFLGISVWMAAGWSYFEYVVKYKKSDKKKKSRVQLHHRKINHPRHKFAKRYEAGRQWCEEQDMKDCYIRSFDDLLLHARYLPTENAKRFVILCHGYKGNGFSDFAYMAKYLHEHECNLLIIDERCCGESEGEYITFGAKEKKDIQRWAFFVDRNNKGRLPIYLYGESMGAASVIMSSGELLPASVRGIIADCGFRSMKGQLRDMAINWFHFHGSQGLLYVVDLYCRLFGGFRMKDADTKDALRRNQRPILFFHGEKDTFVSPVNTKFNYAICRGPKELMLVKGARHMCSPYMQSEKYRKKIMEFFEKNEND